MRRRKTISETAQYPAGATRTTDGHTALAVGRTAPPRATRSAIEAAVQQALTRLRARERTALIHTRGATDPTTLPVAPRGWQERTVLTAGHPTPVRVRRRSLGGTVCGSGRVPP